MSENASGGYALAPTGIADTPDLVTLTKADAKALLGLLIWVHDSILRQPNNDALIRRVGAAMGRPC